MVGSLNWSDSVGTLGCKLSFSIARNKDDKFMANYDILEKGDKVIKLNNKEETFRGVITDVSEDRYKLSVVALDYAFYLSKNKTIIQFNKISASNAIKKVCKKFNVNVEIESISTIITKIYKTQTVSGIISDILKQVNEETGDNYFYEMYKDKLYIRKYGFESVYPEYKQFENTEPFNVFDAIGSVSKSGSIQDMKNSVLIVSNEEKSVSIKAKLKDDKSISNYGLLQEIITVDKKDKSKASNTCKNKLKELNKPKEEISLNILGSDVIKSGRVVEINVDTFNIKGNYLILSTNHSYSNSIHKCSIKVRKWLK